MVILEVLVIMLHYQLDTVYCIFYTKSSIAVHCIMYLSLHSFSLKLCSATIDLNIARIANSCPESGRLSRY